MEALISAMMADGPAPKRPPHMLLLEELLLMKLLICLLALLSLAPRANARDAQLAAFATGDLAALSFAQAGKAAPTTVFEGKTGPAKLADFKGKVVVLNLWATWCVPCLKELPHIDALAKAMKGKDVVVLAVSQDKASWRAVDPWWTRSKLTSLVPYVEKNMDLGFGLGAKGLPLTLIYDRQGKEVARLAKPADWSSPKAQAMLMTLAARK
jgi:thiol-disulfide isomerase/thioredoxin